MTTSYTAAAFFSVLLKFVMKLYTKILGVKFYFPATWLVFRGKIDKTPT